MHLQGNLLIMVLNLITPYHYGHVHSRVSPYTTRKTGHFLHKKNTKLTLQSDQHTCCGSYLHCGEIVILDQSYFLANRMLWF